MSLSTAKTASLTFRGLFRRWLNTAGCSARLFWPLFFLQLFALVSPLLFQVVIDKVPVNRGLSSLDVLMAAFNLYRFLRLCSEGCELYTFAHDHPGDVELGASLFKHLISAAAVLFRGAAGRRYGGAGA